MENSQTKEKPHIVLLPSTGIGHLNPMIEFAKRLLSHQSLTVSLLTISGQFPASAIAKLSEHPNFNSITLPPVDTSDLPTHTKVVTIISVVVKRAIEPLRKLLPTILPISAFVLDLFCTDVLDVASELNLDTYILFTTTATTLSLLLYLPVLDEETLGEYRDLKDHVKVPGCPPFRGTELVHPMQDRQDLEYSWLLRHSRRYREVAGILINTFDELEPGAIESLQQGRYYRGTIPPVYPIGPLVKTERESGDEESREECLKWLDKQPRGSVLYVCFGSGGTLTKEQLVELAWGLEMSGQRFLWVVRKPQSIATGAFFGTGPPEENEPASFLPEGFLRRTAEVGMVVPEWSPQVEVLSHESIGGFLSHCGWNSTLECMMHGVAMIAWPLYAEQKMNSRMLVEEIGVAVGVDYEKGLVPREEVEQAVRLLMEGEVGKKLKKRADEVSRLAAEALCSSQLRIAQLVDEWANCKADDGRT